MASVASYWKVPPSHYLPTLPGLQRFFVDEAAAYWVMMQQKTSREQSSGEQDAEGAWVGENIL